MNRPLSNAIRKYGWDAFEVEVLEECIDHADMDMAERFWIRCYGSMTPGGYNLEPGGCAKKVVTPDTRSKLSAAHKGRKASDEARRRMSVSGLARPPAKPETRAKISAANTGRKQSREEVEKRRALLRGRGSGEANVNSKLTWEVVRLIRTRAGEPKTVLSKEFSVARSTISKILNNKLWKEAMQ